MPKVSGEVVLRTEGERVVLSFPTEWLGPELREILQKVGVIWARPAAASDQPIQNPLHD